MLPRCLLFAACVVALPAHSAGFVDVLATPTSMSPLAARP
jgi:hypothetical protein